ncbi:MAG TPA: prepilin peptidase [Acidobacteriaceae bacterium]|jgi:prepilin peptidase CpaA|nr:prepilin peptidase [Acidobacteriaceae bacterium]
MTHIQSELIYPTIATACAVVGSVYDVKSRRVPNLVTFPSFLLGLGLHLVLGGWKPMLLAMAAGIICGLVFLVFYLAGGMGAGDVKLITAVGCIAGMSHIVYILSLTAIAGGVMALGLALIRGRLQETFLNVGELMTHHRHKGLQPHPDLNISNARTLRLPYALAIAGGCILTLYIQVTT